jgi:CP family cyanate transporter-like MFS transporter
MQAPPEHQETPAGKTLVVVGIVALAFNLRPAAVSVGPVLQEIIRDMHMSATVAGLLTAMPVIAFSSFGALAPGLARRVGAHRVTLAALLAVVLGLFVRAHTTSTPVFLALSLVGLSGMATANVLLPSLVRLHFPTRVGQMTAVYTTSMAIGLTAASVLTVPIADRVAGEGWRAGLGVWALTALLAVLPWLVLARSDAHTVSSAHAIRMRDIARTRLGWSMAAFFGLQSLQAYAIFGWFAQVYRDAGFSAEVAGLLLGLITAIGIPLSFWVPSRAARMSNQAPLLVGLIACYPLGYLGLMLAPASGAVLWAVVVGVASAVFPLALTLIGLRARTSEGTAALSGFTQSVGYLLAIIGPLGVGVLYDLTGGWVLPLSALTGLSFVQLLAGLAVARPAYIEDQLHSGPAIGPI